MFFVFGFDDHYPSGGAFDCVGVCDTEAAARELATWARCRYQRSHIAVVEGAELHIILYNNDNGLQENNV